MVIFFNEFGTGLSELSGSNACKMSFYFCYNRITDLMKVSVFYVKMVSLLAAGCPFRLSLQREREVVQLKVQAVLTVVEHWLECSYTHVQNQRRAWKLTHSVELAALVYGHCIERQRQQRPSKFFVRSSNISCCNVSVFLWVSHM